MSAKIMETLNTLSSAEEFFNALDVFFTPEVLQVNRLHILKRFGQYLARNPVAAALPEAEQRAMYRQHLQQAYQDFLGSSPAAEKVFKVFQTAGGVQSVQLEQLRATLSTRKRSDV